MPSDAQESIHEHLLKLKTEKEVEMEEKRQLRQASYQDEDSAMIRRDINCQCSCDEKEIEMVGKAPNNL